MPHIRSSHLIEFICNIKELTRVIWTDWLCPGLVSVRDAFCEDMVGAAGQKVGKIIHPLGNRENNCCSQLPRYDVSPGSISHFIFEQLQ